MVNAQEFRDGFNIAKQDYYDGFITPKMTDEEVRERHIHFYGFAQGDFFDGYMARVSLLRTPEK